MQKKRRKFVLITVALVVAVVATMFYFSITGENPDYIRAARLLPDAKQRTREAFGPLTWEEYRKENGINRNVDLSLWKDLADSVPQHIKEYWNDPYKSTSTYHELYIQDREWFKRAPVLVAELHSEHQLAENGTEWDDEYRTVSGDIVKALVVGLAGAAQEDDAEAVLQIGGACNALSRALLEEPSDMNFLRQNAISRISDRAVLRAAVSNREDKAVLQILKMVVADMPVLPSFSELIVASARAEQALFNDLRSLSTEELEKQLDSLGLFISYSAAEAEYIKLWEEFSGDEIELNRRLGPSTAAAFEARYWQVRVDVFELLKNVERLEPGLRRELRRYVANLMSNPDRSYELIAFQQSLLVLYFSSYQMSHFDQQATRVALELLSRFPAYDQLPEALPADLVFADQFGGGPVLFKKTQRGFLIYSRYSNLKDDGFQWSSPNQKGFEASYIWSLDNKDRGLIISYDPIDPEF